MIFSTTIDDTLIKEGRKKLFSTYHCIGALTLKKAIKEYSNLNIRFFSWGTDEGHIISNGNLKRVYSYVKKKNGSLKLINLMRIKIPWWAIRFKKEIIFKTEKQ